MDSQSVLNKVIEILDDKKAKELRTIQINHISSIADYFVICSGTSSTHIKSLSDAIGKTMRELEYPAKKIEGYQSAQWILMDYGDVVVNIFDEENRQYYALEKIWAEAKEA
jgi:ribosome-associated protein